jgi:hypothetical protein
VDTISLITGLTLVAVSSPSFEVRNRFPLHHTPPVCLALAQQAASDDLEVICRVAAALDQQRRERVAAYLDNAPIIPWIDAINPLWRSDIDADRGAWISGYLASVPWATDRINGPPEWPRHRLAMRAYCVAELDLPEVRRLFASIPSPYHWWQDQGWVMKRD